MTGPAAGAARRCFLIDASTESDALLRVLTPFAVQGVDLLEVTLVRTEGGICVRVETEGLDARRAETLTRRLEGLPVVIRVGLGWRAAAQAAA
ncbi:MAG: hypothetical protein E7812_02430 [Phenylobacterium sp.]|nr:MAG: hypothetical protein E7812_02430 [Phenylobacterium sp.]